MRKMISAAVMLVILFFLQDAFRHSVFSGLVNIAFAGSVVYFIYTVINNFRNPPASKNKPAPVIQQPVKRSTGNGWLFTVVIIALVTYFNRRAVGRYSFGTFAYLDRLVHITDDVPPFIAWGTMGLLVGAVYGSIVAWRKYKLHYTVNLIPLGVFIAAVFVLVMADKPAASHSINNPAPGTAVHTDSSINVSSLKKYIVNRWKVTDVIGRNREFMQKKNGVKKELEFRKNGKCFLYENGVRNAILYYTIAPDGRTLSFSNPNNNLENRQIEIISITRNELVIRSAMFQNDTAVLKAK